MKNENVPQEVIEAWQVIADYLSDHRELSFFIDPWDADGERSYSLIYLETPDKKKVYIATSEYGWNK